MLLLMIRPLTPTIFFSILVAWGTAGAGTVPGPYGVIFGQEYDVLEHKSIRRRENVRTVKLRTADKPDDTKELRAEICDRFGLQIVTWKSHIRGLDVARERHVELANEISDKFGVPTSGPAVRKKKLVWQKAAITVVLKIRRENSVYQNQIRYFGPKNEPCLTRLMKRIQSK